MSDLIRHNHRQAYNWAQANIDKKIKRWTERQNNETESKMVKGQIKKSKNDFYNK